MEVKSRLDDFYVGSPDACERVISTLQYAGYVGRALDSRSHSNNSDRYGYGEELTLPLASLYDSGPKDEDEVNFLDFEEPLVALEKGSVYRGMLPAMNDLPSLHQRLHAVTDKFSEIRGTLQVTEHTIDIQRYGTSHSSSSNGSGSGRIDVVASGVAEVNRACTALIHRVTRLSQRYHLVRVSPSSLSLCLFLSYSVHCEPLPFPPSYTD